MLNVNRKRESVIGMLALLAVPVLAWAASTIPDNVDELYRECMRGTYAQLDAAELQGYKTYNDALEFSLQKRMDDRQRAWNVSNASDRNGVLSSLDRIFKQEVADAKRALSDTVKFAKQDAKNQQTDCKAAILTAYKKDKRCQSTSECSSSSYTCSTERDACDTFCGPSELCIDGCVGYCEKN